MQFPTGRRNPQVVGVGVVSVPNHYRISSKINLRAEGRKREMPAVGQPGRLLALGRHRGDLDQDVRRTLVQLRHLDTPDGEYVTAIAERGLVTRRSPVWRRRRRLRLLRRFASLDDSGVVFCGGVVVADEQNAEGDDASQLDPCGRAAL
jgi:hypothetical protein